MSYRRKHPALIICNFFKFLIWAPFWLLQIQTKANVLHADPGFSHSGTGSGSKSKRLFQTPNPYPHYFQDFEDNWGKITFGGPFAFPIYICNEQRELGDTKKVEGPALPNFALSCLTSSEVWTTTSVFRLTSDSSALFSFSSVASLACVSLTNIQER
jgi:hypothetical protein